MWCCGTNRQARVAERVRTHMCITRGPPDGNAGPSPRGPRPRGAWSQYESSYGRESRRLQGGRPSQASPYVGEGPWPPGPRPARAPPAVSRAVCAVLRSSG
eukprot:scaffold2045_cov404-Prasinococcus_capsulatus_cf.AAC.81